MWFSSAGFSPLINGFLGVFFEVFLLTVWTLSTSPVNSLQVSLLSVTSGLAIPLGCRLGAPHPLSSSCIIWSGNRHQTQRITPLLWTNKKHLWNATALNGGMRSESEFRDAQQGPIHNNHQIKTTSSLLCTLKVTHLSSWLKSWKSYRKAFVTYFKFLFQP